MILVITTELLCPQYNLHVYNVIFSLLPFLAHFHKWMHAVEMPIIVALSICVYDQVNLRYIVNPKIPKLAHLFKTLFMSFD